MAAFAIRHVMTAKNHPNEHQSAIRAGGPDIPISGEGRQQLAKLVSAFHGVPVHTVYSSDTRRAGETGAALARGTGARLKLHPGLRPWDIPAIAGKKYADVEPLLKSLVANPDRRPPGGGMTFRQFFNTRMSAMKGMLNESHDRHIAMVTHGRNIKLLWSLVKGQGGFHPDVPVHDPSPTHPGDIYHVTPDDLKLLFRAQMGQSEKGASS